MTILENPKELLQEEIISYLLESPEYFEQSFAHLDKDYFDYEYQVLFSKIEKYYNEYKKPPVLKELVLMFKDSSQKEKEILKAKIKEIQSISKEKKLNTDFLIDATEQYIKRKIFEKSIITGAEGLGSTDTEIQQNKLAESFKLAEEAVKVSLKSDLGVEFTETDKLDFTIKKGLLTNIPSFDKVLGTGYMPGTLNSAMAPSGIGKTATLIAFACEFAKQKRDVVFVSMEESESQLYKKIYANLLNIPVGDIGLIDKEVIKMRVKEISPTIGKIITKQYPAKRITPLGIASFLDKLKNERGVVNPILIVDYLGLLKSDFMKNMDNSYAYIGSIAEELRAIAIEKNIIVFSPMQLNRSAYGNLEAGNESLSESMKVLHTLDSAFMILQTPEMKEAGKIKISFTKNRFSGITRSFEIGFDYKYFKFEDKFFINGENITETKASDEELDKFNDQLSGLML